jgi:hypothetical protein
VDPSIVLAPGAEDSVLATWIHATLARNVTARPESARDFGALRAAVAMVATDLRQAVTLRFDLGQLTLHDGIVGIPDLTLSGEEAALRALEELPMARTLRLPLPPLFERGAKLAAWKRCAGAVVLGKLQIYGALAHPRALGRLLCLISRA